MNFIPFITLLTSLYKEIQAIVIWHNESVFSTQQVFHENPELKPLVLKHINGSGHTGKLTENHHLAQSIGLNYTSYYLFLQNGQTALTMFSKTELNQSQIQTLFNHETNQQHQNAQIRNFIHRKFESERLKQLNKLNLDDYTTDILIASIYMALPILKNENVKFSPELLQEWIRQQQKLDLIIASLDDFIQLSQSLNLTLHNYSVVPEDLSPTPIKRLAVLNPIKVEKVSLLLTRYERAAEQLHRNNLDINGKNIAAFLSPPVSPAAITDALKKNRKKIISLLLEHPHEWILIRKNLKALRDLQILFA